MAEWLVIRFMYALSRLEQRDGNDATSDVFSYFLLFEQDGGQDVVMDEENHKEEQHVSPCVKQSILDPERVLGIIIDDKL